MTTILILIACYLWALMVYSNEPSQLSARRGIAAPVAACLLLSASLLVWLSNALSGLDSEVQI